MHGGIAITWEHDMHLYFKRAHSSAQLFGPPREYLRRLESKGYVNAELNARVRVYSPRVRPATVIRETVGDLIDRLFGGETLPLMRHLIEDGRVTQEDLASLKDMIDRMDASP